MGNKASRQNSKHSVKLINVRKTSDSSGKRNNDKKKTEEKVKLQILSNEYNVTQEQEEKENNLQNDATEEIVKPQTLPNEQNVTQEQEEKENNLQNDATEEIKTIADDTKISNDHDGYVSSFLDIIFNEAFQKIKDLIKNDSIVLQPLTPIAQHSNPFYNEAEVKEKKLDTKILKNLNQELENNSNTKQSDLDNDDENTNVQMDGVSKGNISINTFNKNNNENNLETGNTTEPTSKNSITGLNEIILINQKSSNKYNLTDEIIIYCTELSIRIMDDIMHELPDQCRT